MMIVLMIFVIYMAMVKVDDTGGVDHDAEDPGDDHVVIMRMMMVFMIMLMSLRRSGWP